MKYNTEGRTAKGIIGVESGYTNEVVPKHRFTLDHLVRINAIDATERRKILDMLARKGIKDFGGVPVDQVVKVHGDPW